VLRKSAKSEQRPLPKVARYDVSQYMTAKSRPTQSAAEAATASTFRLSHDQFLRDGESEDAKLIFEA
jgi:hypothetical protein